MKARDGRGYWQAGLNQLGSFSKQRPLDDDEISHLVRRGGKRTLGERIRISAAKRNPKITLPNRVTFLDENK